MPETVSAASASASTPRRGTFLAELAQDFRSGRADLLQPGSFCAAVVRGEGQIAWADPEFEDLIGDPAASPDCRRLVRLARLEGRAAGLADAAGRGPVVVEARGRSIDGEWPLPAPALAALAEVDSPVLLVVFAPSRSPGLSLVAARALGLTPREADLAVTLIEAPSLAIAASRAGMTPQTGKETLQRACRRLGARNASDLVARLMDLSCGLARVDAGIVAAVLGLTPAEARVALAAALGRSVEETAGDLDLSLDTVKSHRKAIFAKTGVSRDRDLRRLLMEASRAAALEGAAEVVLDDRAAGERLNLLTRLEEDRRIAWIDYGPASGRALFVLHGFNSWRRLPLAFVGRLQRDGWRPMVVQRPGYGHTDPAPRDYLETAADDMAAVLDGLKADRAALLARGGAVPVATTFAARHPSRFLRAALINPMPTRERMGRSPRIYDRLVRLLISKPALIAPLVDWASRRTSSGNLRALIRRLYADMPDRLPLDRPEILDHLVRDAQGLVARGTRGLLDELNLYARGWTLPTDVKVGPWRVAVTPSAISASEADACAALPGYERRSIEGVAVLRAYIAPGPLADLLLD